MTLIYLMVVLRDFNRCSKVCSDVSEQPTACLQGENLGQHPPESDSITLKMETVRFSETSEEDFSSRLINSRKYRHFNKSCESLKT
jgi:hypothetical protein